MKTRPNQTEDTKETIKSAFFKIYKEKNISRITVNDIVTAAGYNRSTFYRYFTDVYDVLEQIEKEILDQFDMRFDQITRCARQMDMKEIIKYTLAPCKVYNKYLAVLLGANGDPTFQAELKEKAKNVLSKQMAIRYGTADVMGEFYLEYCVSGLLSCTRMWYEQDSAMDINDYISMMYVVLTEPLDIFNGELQAGGDEPHSEHFRKTEETV
jgi:AcrR family transcriptional regulator